MLFLYFTTFVREILLFSLHHIYLATLDASKCVNELQMQIAAKEC